MKTRRLLTVIAVLSISLLVFLIAFNSVILGNDKTSESTTETLISQIQDLRKEIEDLKEQISRLEDGQKIPPTVPQAQSPIVPEDLPSVNITPRVVSPTVPQVKPPPIPRDLPSVNTTPHMNQLPKGSERREINGMTYYIVPLQDQNVDK
jgi:hypothetical protein